MSNSTLDRLLSRRSVKLVGAPGPTEADIESALACVVRAPDHAKLRLWRFVLIRQPDIVAVGEKAISIMAAAGKPMTPEKQASTRAWLADLPLLIGLAYQIHHDHPKVPEIEQTLAMGAGVMNFQNAMHAMGFATYWSTGLATFTEDMPEYLGFDTLEQQFVGFLAVGTPKNAVVPAERPDPWSIARRWQAD
ncbi:nitroreductase family protein [Orrella daihaiensis]|uniref:Putative NAD(P)H nitroreductase n=1 Tax=Orrella daihaiensis TaxID=2782176 RepID=A0ABY4ATL4_9BURK|nr:nitroreductase [Orrella daihaiensis]UOD51394.1 nitroreductase [Orrella daihaiensis]